MGFELWAVVGTQPHGNAQVDEIFNDGLCNFPRGRVVAQLVNDGPSGQAVRVDENV
jgi:hypothetical protein